MSSSQAIHGLSFINVATSAFVLTCSSWHCVKGPKILTGRQRDALWGLICHICLSFFLFFFQPHFYGCFVLFFTQLVLVLAICWFVLRSGQCCDVHVSLANSCTVVFKIWAKLISDETNAHMCRILLFYKPAWVWLNKAVLNKVILVQFLRVHDNRYANYIFFVL